MKFVHQNLSMLQITQAIHVSMGQGSYVESSIPWVTEETGFQSFIKGQLLLLEATTSMQFRSLLECETLDVSNVISKRKISHFKLILTSI